MASDFNCVILADADVNTARETDPHRPTAGGLIHADVYMPGHAL